MGRDAIDGSGMDCQVSAMEIREEAEPPPVENEVENDASDGSDTEADKGTLEIVASKPTAAAFALPLIPALLKELIFKYLLGRCLFPKYGGVALPE